MYFTIYDCVEFFEEFMTVYCESHQYIHEKLISKFCYEELNQNGYTHIIWMLKLINSFYLSIVPNRFHKIYQNLCRV